MAIMPDKHIVLIVPGGVDRSGVERVIPVLLGLIEEFARRYRVTVFSLAPEPLPSSYPLCGAQIYALGSARLGNQLARMIAILRDDRPAVFHAFWFGATSTLALVAGKILQVPVVVSLGGGELTSLPTINYGGRRALRSRIHNELALRFAKTITAGSDYALQPIKQRRNDARRVPLGVKGQIMEKGKKASSDTLRAIHVASLNRVKDQPTLLRAVALAMTRLGQGQFTLDIVGEDTLNGAVQREAQSLGLDSSVRFHGFLPNERVRSMVNAADLALMSSQHESQCVAVLEAAMAGVPTIGTAVGLLPELAPQRAWAVPVGDAAALADGIVALVHDEERRRAMGSAAHDWAMAHDVVWTAQQFEKIYWC
jgi:glycosyltransferase involved in cell wall biosynthesis